MIALLCAASLASFSHDFWTFRAATQPVTRDDVPRVERPPHWAPDWSRAAVEQRRKTLAALEARFRELPAGIDRELLGSALARVHWELDGVRSWRRDPGFYVDQTVSAVVDALIQDSELLPRLRSIPATLQNARENLDEARAPFARLALADLEGIGPRFQAAMEAVHAPSAETRAAIKALEQYRAWLQQKLPSLREDVAIGRDAYVRFLREVALIPFTPEELLAMGRQELARSIAFQTYEAARDRGVPELPIAATQDAQIALAARGEEAIRRYLVEKQLLSVPAEIPHYRYRALPPALAALRGFGEETRFSRLAAESLRWIPAPSKELGFFALSMAQDPRVDTVHEGVPGHAFQLAVSEFNPDEVRRHWYDSGVNEGLGTYAEEMMLEAGLFDDSPHSREMVYRYLRLRALRVEADVQLALGGFTIEQAAEYLRSAAQIDAKTARDEAASFAATPGFAIGYLIGKLQIQQLVADAVRLKGMPLREVHDFIWRNGNVPLSLQRRELLGEKP